MLARTISTNTLNQVSCVLDDIVSKVIKKQKRISWGGITNVASFELEDDRKLSRIPFSKIRIHNSNLSNPFIIPKNIIMMKPIKEPTFMVNLCHDNHNLECESVIMKVQSNKVEHIYPNFKDDNHSILPRTRTFNLSEVFDIANNMKLIDNYNKFIHETNTELQLGNNS